jgi:hypothetical protein
MLYIQRYWRSRESKQIEIIVDEFTIYIFKLDLAAFILKPALLDLI